MPNITLITPLMPLTTLSIFMTPIEPTSSPTYNLNSLPSPQNFTNNTSVNFLIYNVINIKIDFIFGIVIYKTLPPTYIKTPSLTSSQTKFSTSYTMTLLTPSPIIIPILQTELTSTFLQTLYLKF